jgi:hypothetical protein
VLKCDDDRLRLAKNLGRPTYINIKFILTSHLAALTSSVIEHIESSYDNMRKFFNKAKSQFQDSSPPQKPIPQQNQQNAIQPPTAEDVIRYRYHHGVNLGSVFVLEKWLFSDIFIDRSCSPNLFHHISSNSTQLSLEIGYQCQRLTRIFRSARRFRARRSHHTCQSTWS